MGLFNKNKSTETPEEEPKKKKSKGRVIFEWILTGVFAIIFVFAGIGQINAMVNKKANFGENLPYGYGSFVVKTNSMEPEYKVGTAIVTHKLSGKAVLDRFLKDDTSELTFEDSERIVYTALWTEDDKEHNKVDITFSDRYTERFYAYDMLKYNNQTNPTGVPMTHRLREIHVSKLVDDKDVKKYTFIVAGINKDAAEALSAEGQYQAFTSDFILGVVILNSAFLGGFFGFISSPWGLLVFLLIPAFYLVITSVLDIFKAMKDPEEETIGADNNTETPKTNDRISSLDELSKEERERLKREMLEEMMKKKGEE